MPLMKRLRARANASLAVALLSLAASLYPHARTPAPTPAPRPARAAIGGSGGGGNLTPGPSGRGTLWVDARDFGARPDSGTTDNRGPIQAAVDHAASLLPPGTLTRATVYLPGGPGAYETGGSVWVDYNGVEIVGDGTDNTTVFNVSRDPAFRFGVARSQQTDVGGTMGTLVGNGAYRPDVFGKLDTSVATGNGQRWGLRTNNNAVVQFDPGCPLGSGVNCAGDAGRSDQWTETTKLTVEFCVEPPDGQLLPAGVALLGVGSHADPAPWFVGVGNSNRLLISFRTSDMTNNNGDPNREFLADLTPFSPPYRVAFQVDCVNRVYSVYINNTQVSAVTPANLDTTVTSASPVPWPAGSTMIVNDHYPFMLGGSGVSGAYSGATGLDLRVYGLRVSNTLRYLSNGSDTAQTRADSPATALNDAWAYYGSDGHTVAYLAGTDNPASAGRVVTVAHGGAVRSGPTSGVIMNQYTNIPSSQCAIRDMTVVGSGGFGQVVQVGYIFNFTAENLRVAGGYHAIGSFPIGSSYDIYLRGNNTLSGSDAAYFGVLQLVIAPDRTEFPDTGRITMRFAGCNVHWNNCFFGQPPVTSEGLVKARRLDYGGNYRFENFLVDFEGYSITGAMFHVDAHGQSAATSLVLKDIALGTVGEDGVIVRLRDTAAQSGSLGRAYLYVENLSAQTAVYRAMLDLDGPLWHGEVKGGAVTGTQVTNSNRWGAGTNVVFTQQ